MAEKRKKEEIKYTEPKAEARETRGQTRPEIVDFSMETRAQEQARNLAELAGKVILIYSYEVTETRLGPRLEITAEVDNKIEKFYSFSRIIIDQLRRYNEAFKQGKALRAKVERRKRYLTLAPP